ncbi:hypothetical protein HY523_01540, partial [Candidatus Berkelbacteria bacterium]|nr:hypothetical protein [Candidatus Berkelbacteria bacterium]
MVTKVKKLLVSHARPHLDDVAAIWLLTRYHPEYTAAQVRFLPRRLDGGFRIPRGALALGIGGGQFDEHKGDFNDCAATLVWKWLKMQPTVTLDPVTERAVERLIEYILQGDLGKLNAVPWRTWSIAEAFFGYAERVEYDDQKTYHFGVELLESVLVGLI